jgi:hypothetical protein
MTALCREFFQVAAIFYVLSLVALGGRFHGVGSVLFVAGLAANLFSAVFRIMEVWPMLPLYQSPFFLALAIGILSTPAVLRERRWITLRLLPVLLTALLALFFPKDYYLPFAQSATIHAHLFFLFGVLGRACFFVASTEALLLFTERSRGAEVPIGGYGAAMRWIPWGFAFLTVSLFSGEAWSYLGWGSPIVWDDPSVAATMAIWCYYACILHMHLSRNWSSRGRLAATAAGALLVFLFTAVAEMGVFQWPR